ncbi:MAG: hypothetical protein IKG69_08240, partial [Atopobiaceae bacterium]|nr:hypothetical protein [Atopobiaceae bacterium]
MKQRVYPWLIVVGWAFIVSATFELIVLGGSNFFRSVAVDLGVSVSQVALVVTVCSLSLAVSAPVAGRLFDKVDSRILLTAMGLIVVAAFASLSWGQHVWQWWLAGLLYGVG